MKCIVRYAFMFIILICILTTAFGCFSRGCSSGYRKIYLSKDYFKCVTNADDSGNCPPNTTPHKKFGCVYGTNKQKKSINDNYSPSMYGQRQTRTINAPGRSNTAYSGSKSGRG